MIDEKAILLGVLAAHRDARKWDGADFERIKFVSNTKVGDVGQEFVEALCTALKLDVTFPANKKGLRAKQSPWDVCIEGVEFELKTASEDVSNAFQFNHIRYHRTYHGLICLGIAPSDIYFNIWPKADVTTGKAGSLVSMEKGANASYKLTKKSNGLFPINLFHSKITEFTTKYKAESP